MKRERRCQSHAFLQTSKVAPPPSLHFTVWGADWSAAVGRDCVPLSNLPLPGPIKLQQESDYRCGRSALVMSPTPLGAAQGRGPGQGRRGRCCAHTPPTYVLGSTSCHSWNEVKALPPTSPLPSTESPVCSSQEKSCACKLSELKTTGSQAAQLPEHLRCFMIQVQGCHAEPAWVQNAWRAS